MRDRIPAGYISADILADALAEYGEEEKDGAEDCDDYDDRWFSP